MSIAISQSYQLSSAKRFVSKVLEDTPTQIRLQLCIPKLYQESIISQLISSYGITVNITGIRLEPNTDAPEWIDVELKATPKQLQEGIAYLQSFNITIIGKANPGYDGWHL
jgi:L-aspartate semialdehyde sulfurtransferase ferredoxin